MQDISRQLGIAVRWLPLVLILAIGASTLAYTYFAGRPEVYQSTSHLIVDPGLGASTGDRAVALDAATVYARTAESKAFARSIINSLGLDESPADFTERISTEIDAESLILSVSATAGGGAQARRIANRVGEALISDVRQNLITPEVRDADAAIERNERLITQLNRRRVNLQRKANKTPEEQSQLLSLPREIASLEESITLLRSYSSSNVRNLLEWFEQPRVPNAPIAPRPMYWALLALVAGGMLAAAIAFIVEYLRTVGRVREERDLELATGLASLGTVWEAGRHARQPRADRLAMLHYPRSDEAEAYRGLVARLGFSGGSSRTLMVASARPTEARSLVAANIALAFADAGRNVILVDADYRSPHIHSFFGVKNDRGLTTTLTDSNVPLGWATVPSPHPRLGLMTSGPTPPESAEPLGSRQLNALLRRLLQAADMVIFDSPAIESNLDAAVIAKEMHAMLVVPRDTKEGEVEVAAQTLETAESEFLGAVLYRKVRRSRRGAKAKITPAPEGWGPTWPMMYEQPARITAAVGSAAQGAQVSRPPGTAPAATAPPPPQSARAAQPGQPAAPPQSGRAAAAPATAGPYSSTFRAPQPPPPAPGSQSRTRTTQAPRAPRTDPSVAPQPGSTGQDTSGQSPARSESEPREGDPRVAIPVQPQQGDTNGSSAKAPTSEPAGSDGATGPKPTNPESVPG